MIAYSTTRPGDKLRIVGAGAPGFAELGDIVTVIACNGHNRADVVHDRTGEAAYFALTCGAQRLEPVPEPEEDPNLLITRTAPAWAWDIIDETLDMDSQSNAFDRNLRQEIAAALKAMEEL